MLEEEQGMEMSKTTLASIKRDISGALMHICNMCKTSCTTRLARGLCTIKCQLYYCLGNISLVTIAHQFNCLTISQEGELCLELNTKIPTMLQARVSIQKYLFVKNDEVAQHVSLYYAAYLIQHPNLIP